MILRIEYIVSDSGEGFSKATLGIQAGTQNDRICEEANYVLRLRFAAPCKGSSDADIYLPSKRQQEYLEGGQQGRIHRSPFGTAESFRGFQQFVRKSERDLRSMKPLYGGPRLVERNIDIRRCPC